MSFSLLKQSSDANLTSLLNWAHLIYDMLQSPEVIGAVFQKSPNLHLDSGLNNKRNLVAKQRVVNLITKTQ